MKFGLSKHLGYIVAIPLISSCCFASEQKYQDELTREMYKHSWRAHLSKTWKCADIKAKTWWKAEMYEDSIFDVIPQAIADCMTHNAEFDKNKFTDLQNKYNIIEFHDATPDKMTYSPANWNAVMLWNFIYRALCVEPDEDDYKKVLKNIMADLARYYARYPQEFKVSLDTHNNKYLDSINRAMKDIEQYIEEKGVNLIGYINEIKKISEKDRMMKAPHARIIKGENKYTETGVITAYPLNQIDNNSKWAAYKVNYSKDVKQNGVEWNKYIGVPVYTIPEGIVEYKEEIKQKKGNIIYRQLIFQLKKGDEWKNTLHNELPINYSLSYRLTPDNMTKEQMDAKSIDQFAERVAAVMYDGMLYPTLDPDDYKLLTATEHINSMMHKGWDKRKNEEYHYVDPGFLENQDKIEEFRDTFNLSEDEYSDERVYKILEENDFNFENAFSSLFG